MLMLGENEAAAAAAAQNAAVQNMAAMGQNPQAMLGGSNQFMANQMRNLNAAAAGGNSSVISDRSLGAQNNAGDLSALNGGMR